MMIGSLRIGWLGQSGVRFSTSEGSVLIDPYLTDSVAETFGEQFKRLQPSPVRFEELADTKVLLITHAHLDHCDPASVLGIMNHAPGVRIVAPLAARAILTASGVPSRHIEAPEQEWTTLFGTNRVHAVPAVHPTPAREDNGEWQCVGYVLEFGNERFYHAGDTSPAPEIVDAVLPLCPRVGFLPVNERNYYRDRSGIIGNMSTREAFAFAEEIGLTELVPLHWDLFSLNSVEPEEIRLVHQAVGCPVALRLLEAGRMMTPGTH